MDALFLSRIQFALTIMFHYLFPPLTIGMGAVLVYLDGMALRTGLPVYAQAARFWTRIFALNFAMGVATGIVMEFEFGTNWATYARFVGDVFGSALAAEGIFAFFLESGFLAILVFGWDRVSPRAHFLATCMVALGAVFSSIWIVVANSWQQTPAGHHIVPVLRDGVPWVVDGVRMTRAEIVDFWAMVFNPSSVQRLVHVWIGCLIMGGFFIMSISAWYILKQRHCEFAERSFRGALAVATLAAIAALVSGHQQARSVYRTQPAKLAAFEAHFETGPASMNLAGWPDAGAQRIDWNLAIPGLLSFLIHGRRDAPVAGLDRFRPPDRPPVLPVFLSYHLMVGLGVFFLSLTLLASLLLWRGTLFTRRWLMWVFVFAVLGAAAANQAGWVAAEVGRQPWIVHPPVPYADGELVLGADNMVAYDESLGLRTSDAVSKTITRGQVAGSIVMFGVIYALLLAVWIFVLNDKIRKGPEPLPGAAAAGTAGLRSAVSARVQHRDSLTTTGAPRRRDEEGGA
jgi:cytochrome d ubiquinol oxidase subunit I